MSNKVERETFFFVLNLFSIRRVSFDTFMYAKKNANLRSTNYFTVAKGSKRNETSHVAIKQNITKWDAVLSAWRVSRTQRKGRRFLFFFSVPRQDPHVKLCVTRQRCWCSVSLKVSLWSSCFSAWSRLSLFARNHLDRKSPLHSAFESQSSLLLCAWGQKLTFWLSLLREEEAVPRVHHGRGSILVSLTWPEGLKRTNFRPQSRRCPKGWVLEIPQNFFSSI